VIAHGEPSLTALTAAAARAAHLIVDNEPVIFADTLAQAMLGERAEELLSYHRVHGTHPVLAGARAQVMAAAGAAVTFVPARRADASAGPPGGA
jgi:hypothetical protein